MDFEFATEHESFRKEFRDWLAASLPPELCLDDASDDRVPPGDETSRKVATDEARDTSDQDSHRSGRDISGEARHATSASPSDLRRPGPRAPQTEAF